MNTFEHLEDEACRDGIEIMMRNFKSDRIKGLYSNNVVAINKNMVFV